MPFGLVTWLAIALAAQIELPQIAEVVTVSVVNVDVVVTDRAGNHVRGLTRDDFILLEDGKPQDITHFSEIAREPVVDTAKASTPEVPPRSLVIFLDSGSIGASHRSRVFRALKEFIRESVGERDEVMVVSWNRKLRIEAMPTHNVAVLLKAIDGAALRVPSSLTSLQPSLVAGASNGPAMTTSSNAVAERRTRRMTAIDVQQGVRALNAVLSRMAGAAGRKALVLVSEGFAIRASGLDADLSNEELEIQQLIESVSRTANAAGVTLYTFHAAGLVAGMSAADASATEGQTRVEAARNSVTSLQAMAAQTGGLIASGDDFRGAFAKVAGDFDAYYFIGYRATADRAGRERRIEVRAKDSRYVVRSRKTFVERSAEAQMRDEVVANLLFPSRTNHLRIRARLGPSKRVGKRDVSVPVQIAIPLPSLTLLPKDDKYVGGFHVFLAAGDSDNAMSDVVRRSHRISFDAADLQKAMTVAYIYSIDIQTARGNRLSIAVQDEISGASGFTSINVPR
jgi:VWFA-related protein